jgi:hypothetical protein
MRSSGRMTWGLVDASLRAAASSHEQPCAAMRSRAQTKLYRAIRAAAPSEARRVAPSDARSIEHLRVYFRNLLMSEERE